MRDGKSSSVVAGIVGGAVVAAFFAVLLAVGVIDTGDDGKTVVRQVGGGTVDADLPSVHEIYQDAGPGVVNIRARVTRRATSPFEQGGGSGVSTGSGFVLDKDGYILTNAHVVEGAGSVTVQFEDDTSFPAKIVGSDLSSDLALLQVSGQRKSALHPVELGEAKGVQVGDPVIAIGNPFGLDRTVTTGIVSALQREIEAPNNFSISDVIQTDAAVNPGNSGGPLLDATGKVIGVNSQIATANGQGGNVGIAFAVPIDEAKRVIPELKKSGRVDRAYLGVTTVTLTEAIAEELNLDRGVEGALVQEVVSGGPADKGGIRAGSSQATVDGQTIVLGGDIIVNVDGKAIKTNADVAAAIEDNKVGETIQITVQRRGDSKTLRIKLGRRPNLVR